VASPDSRPTQNILFISIEDLNDWIEPLGGHPDTITPNLQRLADRAKLFTAAYTPAPACSPARTAALFGKNPWETGVYDNPQKWWQGFKNDPSLSIMGRMKSAGFKITGAGKVFHGKYQPSEAALWDAFLPFEPGTPPKVSQAAKRNFLNFRSDFGPLPDEEPHFDQNATNFILERMKSGVTGQFWALGLYRPHLPFLVGKRFYDALPEQISLPPGMQGNQFDVKDETALNMLPRAAKRMSLQRRFIGYQLAKTGEYKDFLRGYLASVHFADHLLGQVLDRMDELNLWKNTHVVLWSDHGWQIGEKLAFQKFTLWERALRIPLMIAGPNISPSKIHAPVSLIDLVPTILEIAGLDPDPNLPGQNLLGEKLREFAVSAWGLKLDTDQPKHALSVRSKTHRLIMYWNNDMELYDHRVDPYEHNNLMFEPTEADLETYGPILMEMLDQMPQSMVDPIWTNSTKNTGNV